MLYSIFRYLCLCNGIGIYFESIYTCSCIVYKERIPQRKNDLIALYEQWKNRTPLGVADLMIVTDDDDVDVNVEEGDAVIDDAVAI